MSKTMTLRDVMIASLMETGMFVLGYLTGLVIREFVIGVDSGMKTISEQSISSIPFGKAIFQIFINAFLVTYLSKVRQSSTLMFSIGLFGAQAKLLGTAIFQKVEKQRGISLKQNYSP
jgi:hypothetical protein